MPTDLEIAYQCAPVIVQKVSDDNPRGDFITRVDFTDPGNLRSISQNWKSVNSPMTEKQWKNKALRAAVKFDYKLIPYVYYSVVETHTHYFVLYAVYHPQDWESADTPWKHSRGPKWKQTEHENDMEGALVIASKRKRPEDVRADAMLTISHWWFYSYANWMVRNTKCKDDKKKVFSASTENRYTGSRVNRENLDGNLWAVWHFDEKELQKTTKKSWKGRMRPKLYIQAKGHGIRGDKGGWGGGDRIIRYCPSLIGADEPSLETTGAENPKSRLFVKISPDEKDVNVVRDKKRCLTDVWRYQLIDIFEPNTNKHPTKGLWECKDDPEVFLVDGKGQDCFVAHDKSKLVAGSARPPWSWDDMDDGHTSGELALQPAHIVYNYLGGIREFSTEYVRNRYLGI